MGGAHRVQSDARRDGPRLFSPLHGKMYPQGFRSGGQYPGDRAVHRRYGSCEPRLDEEGRGIEEGEGSGRGKRPGGPRLRLLPRETGVSGDPVRIGEGPRGRIALGYSRVPAAQRDSRRRCIVDRRLGPHNGQDGDDGGTGHLVRRAREGFRRGLPRHGPHAEQGARPGRRGRGGRRTGTGIPEEDQQRGEGGSRQAGGRHRRRQHGDGCRALRAPCRERGDGGLPQDDA